MGLPKFLKKILGKKGPAPQRQEAMPSLQEQDLGNLSLMGNQAGNELLSEFGDLGSLGVTEEVPAQEVAQEAVHEDVPVESPPENEQENIDPDQTGDPGQFEKQSSEARNADIQKRAGKLKIALREGGLAKIREDLHLTKEEMNEPDAVQRMMDPYFRAALSRLAKDQEIGEEDRKALSEFSMEMDQQMMINSMMAPGSEQIDNLQKYYLEGGEEKQIDRELKDLGMEKVLLGQEGIISNMKRYTGLGKKVGQDPKTILSDIRKEKTLQKESARSLFKIFMMLQMGNMQMRDKDPETGEEKDTPWDYNMSDLFAHGSRIVVGLGEENGTGTGEVLDSLFSKESGFKKRAAATHYISTGGQKGLKEEKGNPAAIKGMLNPKWSNYGLPVAIGGAGNLGPEFIDQEGRKDQRVIKNDNRNGHVYVGARKGKGGKGGALLIGLEGDGPYRTNQWGHTHTKGAKQEIIKATGGMTEDLHGQKVTGRNLYLNGIGNKELAEVMRSLDKGFDRLYGSDKKEDREQYENILRKITGKRMEALEVDRLFEMLTGKKELGFSTEELRKIGVPRKPSPPKKKVSDDVIPGGIEPLLSEEKKEADPLPAVRKRYEVDENPVGAPKEDLVEKFLAAQGISKKDMLAEAEARRKKQEEEKARIEEKEDEDEDVVPMGIGPLFSEDDKKRTGYIKAGEKASSGGEQAVPLRQEESIGTKSGKGSGRGVGERPDRVGQKWLYDLDDEKKYYSAQVSSDPTHFGKHHQLDTSAYLILNNQVIRVDDYIGGQSGKKGETMPVKPAGTEESSGSVPKTEAVPEGNVSAPKPEEKPDERAFKPKGPFAEIVGSDGKDYLAGIQALSRVYNDSATETLKEVYRKFFDGLGQLWTDVAMGKNVKPEEYLTSLPEGSIAIGANHDAGKLKKAGLNSARLKAVQRVLGLLKTDNRMVEDLMADITGMQRSLELEEKYPEPKKKPEQRKDPNPFRKPVKISDLLGLNQGKKEDPKLEPEEKSEPEPEKKPEPELEVEEKDQPKGGPNVDKKSYVKIALDYQDPAGCCVTNAAALLRHYNEDPWITEKNIKDLYGVNYYVEENFLKQKRKHKENPVPHPNADAPMGKFSTVVERFAKGEEQNVADMFEGIREVSKGSKKGPAAMKTVTLSGFDNGRGDAEVNRKNGMEPFLKEALEEKRTPVLMQYGVQGRSHYVTIYALSENGDGVFVKDARVSSENQVRDPNDGIFYSWKKLANFDTITLSCLLPENSLKEEEMITKEFPGFLEDKEEHMKETEYSSFDYNIPQGGMTAMDPFIYRKKKK